MCLYWKAYRGPPSGLRECVNGLFWLRECVKIEKKLRECVNWKRLAWTWKSIFQLRECVNLPSFLREPVNFSFSICASLPDFWQFSRFFPKIFPISRKIGFAWGFAQIVKLRNFFHNGRFEEEILYTIRTIRTFSSIMAGNLRKSTICEKPLFRNISSSCSGLDISGSGRLSNRVIMKSNQKLC